MTPGVTFQYDDLEGCKVMVGGLRRIAVREAETVQAGDRRFALAFTTVGCALFVLWCALMVVRHRVARSRAVRASLDAIGAALALATATLCGVAMFRLTPRYTHAYLAPLVGALRRHNPIYVAPFVFREMPSYFARDGACVETFGVESGLGRADGLALDRAAVADIERRVAVVTVAMRRSPLYIATLILLVTAIFGLLASAVSAAMALCGKASALPDDEGGRAHIGTRERRRRGAARSEGPGGALGSGMPPEQALRFFGRFIERVPPPADGVVIGGGRHDADCRICLEVMLEDIVRLSACQHTFHRRCILQWLVQSDEPCCPLCKEPVRLCETPYSQSHTDADDDADLGSDLPFR